MKINIYQIDETLDKDHMMFRGFENNFRFSYVNAGIYKHVFSGDVKAQNLEDIFRTFNTMPPEGHKGRSMSVSDVVEVVESDEEQPGFYYCDNIGFKEIDFEKELAEPMKEERIKVLIVEPEKAPYVKVIDNNLTSLQSEVNGLIELIYPFDDDVGLICNEEGKICNMPLNRALRDSNGDIYDVIAGTFMVTGLGEEDFVSLDDKMIAKYTEMYKTPEKFERYRGVLHVSAMTEPVKGDPAEPLDILTAAAIVGKEDR